MDIEGEAGRLGQGAEPAAPVLVVGDGLEMRCGGIRCVSRHRAGSAGEGGEGCGRGGDRSSGDLFHPGSSTGLADQRFAPPQKKQQAQKTRTGGKNNVLKDTGKKASRENEGKT